MKCIVTKEEQDPRLGIHGITLEQLAMKEYLPYLASTKWEYISVELCEATPKGILLILASKFKVLPIIEDIENPSLLIVTLLGEIYRDDASELRKMYSRDKEGLVEKLKEMRVEYGW